MKCTQYGLYEQVAFNPGEGQHHGIEEIILKGNYYYEEMPGPCGQGNEKFQGAVAGPTRVCHAGQSSLGFL